VNGFHISQGGVEIRLEIEGEFRIPKDSHVELKSFSLLSGLAAVVVPGTSSDEADSGDLLRGTSEVGLFETANTIAGEAEKTLGRVQALLSESTVQNVELSSAQLKQLLRQLSDTTAEQRRELNGLVGSLRASAGQVEKATAGPELEQSLKRIDELTRRADATVQSLERSSRSLEGVVGKIERGEGTLGKLTHDDTLYTSVNTTVENLNGAASDLRALVQDLKANPRRYLKFSVF